MKIKKGSDNDNRTAGQYILKAGAAALIALLMAVGFPSSLPAMSTGKKPNILFILSDDHRWDAMGYTGHTVIKTPNMDRLAQEGVIFNNAFVTTSLCSPSRASFLTGRYAHHHGVKNNLTPWNNDNITFLELIKKAGYTTGFIGKWHMPGNLPNLRGLDRFVTFTVDGGQGRYFNCPLIVDGKEVPSKKEYITEELTDYANDFITENKNNPFCLYLSHKAAHAMFTPSKKFKHTYDDTVLTLPPESDPWTVSTNGNMYPSTLRNLYKNYLACLTELDHHIGRVLDTLDELGIAENTIVIYAGDNGHFWGEHHLIDKRWPYEESIRIPFIVRYPAMVDNPGRRADQMALNIDLAPTLLEIAGVTIPDKMDGKSLVPVLRNESAMGRKAWLYEYFKDFSYNVPEHTAVRTNQYKYIKFVGKRKPELYDLADDPREMTNLYGTPHGSKVLPDLKRQLKKLEKGGIR
jgi:arylsulfatase A-like enzyme